MEYFGTFGPECNEENLLEKMLNAGMTGIRFNLSHGSLEGRRPWFENLHEAEKKTGKKADFMIDLHGPELRIGDIPRLILEEGKEIYLIPKEDTHKEEEVPFLPVPKELLDAIKEGQFLSLSDGKLRFEVIKAGEHPLCTVVRGGNLYAGKSIAIEGVHIPMPVLTPEDYTNLGAAEELGVTSIMQPFVSSGEDIRILRSAMEEKHLQDLRVFAKIETQDGVEHVDEIIDEADVVVIARGDLGNNCGLEKVPGLQKRIAAACRKKNRPFMVVTQLLSSMMHYSSPTRAEISDIYNAVLDGASSLMLTGETAGGNYPLESMQWMILAANEGIKDLDLMEKTEVKDRQAESWKQKS